MDPLSKFAWKFSANARKKRAALFRSFFDITEDTKILDLGSENGTNIHNVLQGTDARPENIYIADIDQNAVNEGQKLYGFNPILVNEDSRTEFEDNFFDIVFCSSVIEHTTVKKSEMWEIKDGKEFRERSWERQREFAAEIARLGKRYFVQTPCRTFPIESHTWLPLVGFLPRRLFLPLLKASNRFWIKRAWPDFNLLDGEQMQELFPLAKIVKEKKWGFTKSIMAIGN